MTVQESVESGKQLLSTGQYHRQEMTMPNPVSPENNLLPRRDPFLRFSAPYLRNTFPSSDTLRGFHLGGLVPQNRIPVPPGAGNAGGSSTTVNNIINNSSSSNTSTNNPPTSQTAFIDTTVLNPDDQFLGVVLLAKSFYLYAVSVSSAARVRLYATVISQSLDQFRDVLTAPGLGTQQGLIGDINLEDAPTTWFPSPDISGSNGDDPQTNIIYITVDNISAASTTISVSITYVPIQS